MQIQINTDHHIGSPAGLAAHAEQVVRSSVRHAEEQVSRVDVYLSDENGARASGDDKRCVMEAQLKGQPALAVSEHAASVHQALDGAARKLRSALASALGRRAAQQQLPPVAPAAPD